MSRLILILGVALLCCPATAQENIRQIDFKNFTYPLSGNLLGHYRLEWLGGPDHPATKRKPIHLVDGSDLTKTSTFEMNGEEYGQYEGFTFQSVSYGDLTGDGHEQAVVVLIYHTGGTQTTNYVYVYTLDQHRPKLLAAYCHTGNRSAQDFMGYTPNRVCSYSSCWIERVPRPSVVLPGLWCRATVWQSGCLQAGWSHQPPYPAPTAGGSLTPVAK